MALYKVSRTDNILPGEFVDGYAVAGGVAQARKVFAHMEGVTDKNLIAQRVDVTTETYALSAYFDERDPNPGPYAQGF
jgi:hypothetical protein